ncbi:MAG: Crp/Fnr family transcriptional regulator [Actinobacteria bacterium]|nr:Crp/Fnr family transcriptional regulator [Actinomycetota bacterium]
MSTGEDDRVVRVLEVDPDLGERVEADVRSRAFAAATARVERLAEGPWDPPREQGFGLLVLSGFIVRRVGRQERYGAELLGPGDLLRPWQAPGRLASQPFEASWQTIAPAELAVLDDAFVRRVAPYPQIATRLVDRVMVRSRHLALELAILQQRRVEDRLLMLLWLLAERWGYVTRSGVRVAAPLTHALLAELVAARRPSVSTALTKLVRSGQVIRVGSEWVLDQPPSFASGGLATDNR